MVLPHALAQPVIDRPAALGRKLSRGLLQINLSVGFHAPHSHTPA